MDHKSMLKFIGFVCLGLALIAFFGAYERYNTNAANVRMFNELSRGMPFGSSLDLKPAVPTSTKVLVLVGILFTAAGGYLVYQGRS